MPIHGILNTARSLAFYERLQEVTANNVANTNTDAFKADRLTARRLPGTDVAVPVQATDLEPGTLRSTGRTLDVALDGPGFLVVETERGERLTRGGSLRLDAVGRLTDAHGSPVLGEQGPIFVAGRDVEIRTDGEVIEDGATIGHLRLVAAPDRETLRREGYGRFIATTPLEAAPVGAMSVRQRTIEESNADAITSLVDLVNVQRSYGANMDALRAMDSALGTLTNQVGRVD